MTTPPSLKLASLSLVPPGQFRFKHPISGIEFSRHAWMLLRDDVTAHCIGNGYPAISDEDIQQQMCERFGPEIVDRYCEGSGKSVRAVGWHWKEIWAGTLVLGSFLLDGRKRVTQAEAERRAAICAPCPMNSSFAKPCGGNCPELTQAIDEIVGGDRTSQDARLEACAVCGCSNVAQVWVPIENLARGAGDDFIAKAPETCWKRAGLLDLRG